MTENYVFEFEYDGAENIESYTFNFHLLASKRKIAAEGEKSEPKQK